METKFFNPWAETTLGRNRLPHWDQPGAAYFLTFHLSDSLPAGLVAQWKIERANWLAANPEPWSEEQVLKHIRDESGRHFDPELVDIFFARLDEIRSVPVAHMGD